MRERNESREPQAPTTDESSKTDELIDGRHGKHGGGLESEGRPQEQQPHADPPAEHGAPARRRDERPDATTDDATPSS